MTPCPGALFGAPVPVLFPVIPVVPAGPGVTPCPGALFGDAQACLGANTFPDVGCHEAHLPPPMHLLKVVPHPGNPVPPTPGANDHFMTLFQE